VTAVERRELTLTVNGEEHTVRARPMDTLLNVLRSELKLFGAREGCGVGMCGACTVLLDGRPVSSCLMPVDKARHCEIVTIEGLADEDGGLDPVQQAYIDHNAFQCSFCTPGFVLATKALLAETARPTPSEVRHYLAGNLCRCGSYQNIEAAVLDAAERLGG
jgi:aerobic-type carbon monoxide dehydrogenase small subunit (CoxS/CutS family)